MKVSKAMIRYSVIYSAIVALIGFFPMQVYAEEVTPAATPTSVSTETTTRPTTTGAGSQGEKPVKPKTTYTYDSATNRWNTNEWVYDSATNTYQPVIIQSTPAPESTVAPQPQSNETPAQPPEAVKSTVNNDTASNTDTSTNIANALDSLAKTGDASILKNTLAGNATTGDAVATATVINNVNSIASNANNTEAATFVSNVMGDVNGDIMLQPMLLKAMLEAGAKTSSATTVNNDLAITNDITMGAQSGDATVARNTAAGNATSGSAHTVVDVVNLMNSMIASNQSFTGTINIYGNLNGDILIAPDFIPQMLASNALDSGTRHEETATKVTANDTQAIINNVSLAAETGKALVAQNTNAGNAKSGNGETNLVIFNLSGHEIVASNSLLIFVNVLGKWVGVIVDAPQGATAAAIGNGVTTHKQAPPSVTIEANTNATITNNINLASQSGDATVLANTRAGNATTGNATASANILNMSNSQIGLSGWYGILFINVYGSWIGSFGVDTSAGTVARSTPVPRMIDRGGLSSRQAIHFVPRGSQAAASLIVVAPAAASSNKPTAQTAAYTTYKSTPSTVAGSSTKQQQAAANPAHQRNMPLVVGSFALMLMCGLILRRLLFS